MLNFTYLSEIIQEKAKNDEIFDEEGKVKIGMTEEQAKLLEKIADSIGIVSGENACIYKGINQDYSSYSMEIDMSKILENHSRYKASNFIFMPKSIGYFGTSDSGYGSSSYGNKVGHGNPITLSYNDITGKLVIDNVRSTQYNNYNNGVVYYGYVYEYEIWLK